MKRKYGNDAAYASNVVFRPALMPMEAAMLPAIERQKKKTYGTLGMIRYACEDREQAKSGFGLSCRVSGRRSE